MDTISLLNLEKYAGKWYEIYRLPMRAEKDLVNVTATYTLRDDGKIRVLNQGFKHNPNGKHKKAKALAWRPDASVQGALTVRFFGLFKSSYLVLALGDNYEWAIVSTESKKYAWILSREPHLTTDLEKKLLDQSKGFGIDSSRFEKTLQQW
jgi:apolipoprotein D and lipocalin family protein